MIKSFKSNKINIKGFQKQNKYKIVVTPIFKNYEEERIFSDISQMFNMGLDSKEIKYRLSLKKEKINQK